VTLAHNGDSFVAKQAGRLPAHVRQQHLQQWTRRIAVDSERDIQSEPKGIGFAYGGIYPGRLHAKGQLVEKHEVHFSVAKCGAYLLYISLHGQSNQRGSASSHVPGSPFTLYVAPGRAHPLTTQIAASDLPLHAVPLGIGDQEQAAAERQVCQVRLQARDKMGNACSDGGAEVTCGFVDPQSAEQQQQGVSDSKLEASCTDNGDGTYLLEWTTFVPGTHSVFVKMDGLHVLGSPTHLHVSEKPPQQEKPPPESLVKIVGAPGTAAKRSVARRDTVVGTLADSIVAAQALGNLHHHQSQQ